MAANNRESAIKVTLGYEGGYTNHPSDPGGPTNWGITIFDARKYWKADATAQDVKDMPLGVAVEIYRQRYWATQRCDDLPAGVDLVTFDYGVNSGIGRSAKVLQRVVGAAVDGKVGDETVVKVNAAAPVTTVKAICAERISFLHALRTWSVFGKGWGRRVADVEARGVKMALEAKPQAKAVPAVVKTTLDKESKTAATQSKKEAAKAAGTVGAPTGAQAAPADAPYHFDFTSMPHSLLWVGGIVLAILVIYFVWHWNAQRQRAVAFAAVAKES